MRGGHRVHIVADSWGEGGGTLTLIFDFIFFDSTKCVDFFF